ncbi:DUF3304 domain-containing protein [Aromatoleum toluclasticum]|uniref:DUF3304 domain-containing protein n=1 Tax=Aromatoleum toluclasticum TaxID=92003 RepID=UPI000684307B|nr:DUF3304 domain-containing protein [Aromatoleum toluclasticum]
MYKTTTLTGWLSDLLGQALLLGLLAFALTGCDVATRDAHDDTSSASGLSAYNYTTEGIQEFYLDGAWGSGVGIGGGGGVVCCVALPKYWHAGLSTTIEWRRSDCGKGVDENGWSNCRNDPANPTRALKKTILIEPYEKPEDLQVLFLPDDEIRIYVTGLSPSHPEHPARIGTARPLSADDVTRIFGK